MAVQRLLAASCLLCWPRCYDCGADASSLAGCALTGLLAQAGSASAAAAGETSDNEAEEAAFWEDMRRRGLRVRLADAAPSNALSAGGFEDTGAAQEAADAGSDSDESAEEGSGSPGGSSSAALAVDVFYGRPVLRIPAAALLTLDSAGTADETLRGELRRGLAEVPAEKAERISLALAAALERRAPSARARQWLSIVEKEPLPPVFMLTDRQRKAIAGTSVEGLVDEAIEEVALIEQVAGGCTSLSANPISREEALVALGLVLRHALMVDISPTAGSGLEPRLVLAPLASLLSVRRDPDLTVAGMLREASFTSSADGIKDESVLVHVARRDMKAGEEALPLWTGRFSNSELAVRHGIRYRKNPIGVGGNTTLPVNWSPNKNTPNFREYQKFNCTSLKAFELRFSPKGWPMRTFIRCSRVAHHLSHGTYQPNFINRLEELDKWPPPKKYSMEDWLPWTQADQVINKAIYKYCSSMKRQLKETITTAIADDFRKSTDPMDVLLWRLRSDEAKTFRECVALTRTHEAIKE